MKNNTNTQLTVEDKKAVEAVNFTFKFRNELSKHRFFLSSTHLLITHSSKRAPEKRSFFYFLI
jgi:hypothetical protein